MKSTFSLWLKASFALFAVSVVGSAIAVFSFASFQPGTQERCAELGKLLSSNQATAADKEEYSKYCGQSPSMYPAAPADQSISCEDLKKIMDSGQYTADQKAEWANCQQVVPETQPIYTCDDLKKIIDSGSYTQDQKDKWANCLAGKSDVQPDAPAYTCDDLKKVIDSGNYNSDQKQLWLNCQQGYKPVPLDSTLTNEHSTQCQELTGLLKKYSQDPNSADYVNTKAKYDSLCANESGKPHLPAVSPNRCAELKGIISSGKYNAEQKQAWLKCQSQPGGNGPAIGDQARKDCEDLRAKLEKLSSDPSSQDYADTKAQYVKMCYRQEQDTQAKMMNPTTAQDSANFMAETPECKDLRAKIAVAGNSSQTNPQDIVDLKATFEKQCAKANVAPTAGYEDVVLTNPDTYSNPFPDTNINDRQGKAAAELYRRGVLGGFPDGQFKGEKPVNRAEAAKFLLLACGKDTQADYSGKFHDLLKGQWYVPYVEAAAAQGIIGGYADGTFRPANTVNRAEFSKMITLACQLPTDLDHSLFTDVASTDWFATYAGAVQKYSLYPDSVVDNLFKPANLMTRSEVAIAIYQYLTNR